MYVKYYNVSRKGKDTYRWWFSETWKACENDVGQHDVDDMFEPRAHGPFNIETDRPVG